MTTLFKGIACFAAMQASQPGQTVTITTRTDEGRLVMEVADTGHGIAGEHLDQIFDPFFSTKTETVGQGMGLGLPVTRSIIEAMGGTIALASAVEVRTRFTVDLMAFCRIDTRYPASAALRFVLDTVPSPDTVPSRRTDFVAKALHGNQNCNDMQKLFC